MRPQLESNGTQDRKVLVPDWMLHKAQRSPRGELALGRSQPSEDTKVTPCMTSGSRVPL